MKTILFGLVIFAVFVHCLGNYSNDRTSYNCIDNNVISAEEGLAFLKHEEDIQKKWISLVERFNEYCTDPACVIWKANTPLRVQEKLAKIRLNLADEGIECTYDIKSHNESRLLDRQ